jgi:aminomethyltransferase
MEKKTPLYEWHVAHGGKMSPFAGYSMPIQYAAGVVAEHNAVREKAGLFDVSHMGEFVLSGKQPLAALNYVLSNDFTDMPVGRVRYTLMCNDNGGIVDDLVVCKMEPAPAGQSDGGRYMLVVNAANIDKDFAWFKAHIGGFDVRFENISDGIAEIAFQGAVTKSLIRDISPTVPEKYYTLIEKGSVLGIDCIVSRTGYTGSWGYEFFCKSDRAVELWDKLLDAGKGVGIIPCGLGARDTLRLEASMPLYGHEMTDDTTPFEAGLGSAVRMDKADFVGKAALAGRKTPSRVRVGLEVTGRGIVREHEALFAGKEPTGNTTSGTFCPYLKKAMAMALVPTRYAALGTKLEADVRGRRVEVTVTKMPFYKK